MPDPEAFGQNARYALYFDPEPESALSRFGWDWLGRTRTSPEYRGLPKTGLHSDWQASVVAPPRLYGFHATLKAPIRLAPGLTGRAFHDAAQAFAATRTAFTITPLVLSEADGFLSLRTAQREPALHDLADACVRHFDRFREPLPFAESARPGQPPLPAAERAMLERWGYPYVLDTFRFHMTLTQRIDADARRAIAAELTPRLSAVMIEPVLVGALSVFVQPTHGAPFTVAWRFPFS